MYTTVSYPDKHKTTQFSPSKYLHKIIQFVSSLRIFAKLHGF